MGIKQIRKRNGSVVDFDRIKITNAIRRALFDAGRDDGRIAIRLTAKAVGILEKEFPAQSPWY